ncbi:NAD(P)-dependent dehydrogenase (short-subunit alcohol dehydrogenase family) [Novosphingobium sp. 1529]|uniref:SDR family oxidoreductase n=1 Tax=Novosphingobium sp. 1529 TaxID=3156424 RepID=UPI001494EE55
MTRFTPGLLQGRTAFIAGGSSGINLGIAEGLARAGARIAVSSRSADRVAAAVADLRAQGFVATGSAADVRDFDAVAAAMAQVADQWGALDIVVSGAAGNFLAAAKDLSANGFKTVVDIDLLGTFNVFRASYPLLRRPGAALIAITAGQAVHPQPNQIHACAAKAGVNMVTRCLALEWAGEGIRVNAISPGPIENTEGMRRLTPTAEAEAAFKALIPLRCYGAKRDIADLAVYLSSEAARYITGAIFDCDGGMGLLGGGAYDFNG